MQKIFRMQYEKCQGACYAWDNVVRLSELQDNIPRFDALVENMIKIHEPACGNENIRYGIDLDEDSGIFVGSFMHNNKLELFSGKELVSLLERFCYIVNTYWESDVGQQELLTSPTLGHEVCQHGQNDDLVSFIHRWSGLELAA